MIALFRTLFACLFVFIMPFNAYADILITPTRVVIEDRDRFAFVTLVNTTNETKSYEISWIHYRMKEGDGTYFPLDVAQSDFDLSKHLVFSPRRVTLGPRAKQRVRIALQRPENITPGDYYVHMKFRTLPEEKRLEDEGPDDGQQKTEATVSINVSYTIPIIFRAGQPDYAAEIGQISMTRNEAGAIEVSVPVTRTGDYGVLGWMQLFNVMSDGSEELVGELSNANVFSEIRTRNFKVPLKTEVTGGSLRVLLMYNDLGSGISYAERVFPLQ